MKSFNLLRKIFLALVLALTFSSSQAFAADAVQVYDNDEKTFVSIYNQIATKENLFTLEATPKFVENKGDLQVYSSNSIPADANVKALLLKNQSGAVSSIAISAKNIEKLQEALTVSLIIVGLNEKEFESLSANQKENSTTVWCESAQRNIHVEFFATSESIDVVIDATK